MGGDKIDLRGREVGARNGAGHGAGSAVPLRMGLGEMMGIGRLAPSENGGEWFCLAARGVGGALEDDDAIPFGKLHALTIFGEWAQRAFGDKAEAVESAVDVLADRVIAAGDDEIDLFGFKKRDGQRDAAEARGAGGAGGGGEAMQAEAADRGCERVSGREGAERGKITGAKKSTGGAHAVKRGAEETRAARWRVGEQ